MPMKDLRLTINIAVGDGSGGPEHAINFLVPADGLPGFAPTTGQTAKLNTVLNQFAIAIGNNSTPL